jgi:UDP-2,3-diacylglucosamine pyrophosphatase LpxH
MLSLEDVRRDLAEDGRLVSRVLFTLRLPGDPEDADGDGHTPVVFIPDIHLLSSERAAGYQDAFVLSGGKKALLGSLLKRLLDLRDGDDAWRNLAVYQLGDFHDLWREKEHWWWSEDVGDMLDRQVDTHAELLGLFRRLGTVRIVGNHEDKLRARGPLDSLAGRRIASYFPKGTIRPDLVSFPWGPHARVDLLHTDQVDPVETGFFSFLNTPGSRLAMPARALGLATVDEWQHECLEPGTNDSPGPETRADRVLDFRDPAVPKERKKFFAESREWIAGALGPDLEMARRTSVATVAGHTHGPRIVVDGDPPAAVLVDCGSWVNQSSAPGGVDVFRNSQIGVLTGLRISVLQVGIG